MNAAPQWTPKVGDTGLTRDGDEYVVLLVDERLGEYPVIALVDGGARHHTARGGYLAGGGKVGEDLMPPVNRAYANVYLSQDGERGYIGVASLYATAEQAVAAAELEKPKAEAVALRVEVPAWEA
jgi:hypothetical protein